MEQLDNCVKYFEHIFFKEIPQEIICWVAGGAVRDYFSVGYVTSDIDIYFPNQKEFDKLREHLLKFATLTFENDKVINFDWIGKKIQLIKIFFNSVTETIAEFDFTVCCAGVDRTNVYHHETFFVDLARRRLVINKLPYPLSTLRRLQKYILKGYKICNGGIVQLGTAIHQMVDTNPETAELYID